MSAPGYRLARFSRPRKRRKAMQPKEDAEEDAEVKALVLLLEKQLEEQAERRLLIQYLNEQNQPSRIGLEPRLTEIENGFVSGQLTSKEAAGEIYKLTLEVYPALGTA
jgi:hypothetical protein